MAKQMKDWTSVIIRVFGCKAEVNIPSQYLKKLDDRSEPMMFVGYCDESKGYRFINLERPTQVVRARDAVFLRG